METSLDKEETDLSVAAKALRPDVVDLLMTLIKKISDAKSEEEPVREKVRGVPPIKKIALGEAKVPERIEQPQSKFRDTKYITYGDETITYKRKHFCLCADVRGLNGVKPQDAFGGYGASDKWDTFNSTPGTALSLRKPAVGLYGSGSIFMNGNQIVNLACNFFDLRYCNSITTSIVSGHMIIRPSIVGIYHFIVQLNYDTDTNFLMNGYLRRYTEAGILVSTTQFNVKEQLVSTVNMQEIVLIEAAPNQGCYYTLTLVDGFGVGNTTMNFKIRVLMEDTFQGSA